MNNNVLPPWMIYSGSLAGLFWAILQIISWINKLISIPKLEVRLTKEVFFRIIEEGETIFTNAVFIARNGPIEIQGVTFMLKRITGSKKEFTFSPRNIGNKIANPPSPYASNNFLTKSCKTFLAENKPTHLLFMSSLEEYSNSFKKEVNQFKSKVYKYQSELRGNLPDIQHNPEENFEKINEKLLLIESETCGNLKKFVQLEPGNYNLVVNVKYSRIGIKFLKKEAEATSQVTFSVEDNLIDDYNLQLEKFFEVFSRNILFNQNNVFIYPEYQPDNVKEV